MKTTSTAIAFGNTVHILRWVFRRAFRFGVRDADTGSVGWVLPGVPMYWRRLVGRMNHPLIAVRSVQRTKMAITQRSIVNVFIAPGEPSRIHQVFVDQHGPFHYRAVVQNVLYATARGDPLSLLRSSISQARHLSGIAPSSASTDSAFLNVAIRWRRLAARVHVSETTSSVSPQRHVAAAFITTIPESIRAGGGIAWPTPSRTPNAGVQEIAARLAEPTLLSRPSISRPSIRRIVTQAAQFDEEVRPAPAEPFQFRTSHQVARGFSAPHDDFDGPRVTAPARLEWRRSEAAQVSKTPRTVLQPDQHGVARDIPAAVPNVAPQSTQVMTERPPVRAPEDILRDLLSGPVLDRLADDVLSRVDKRMRIERERRGL